MKQKLVLSLIVMILLVACKKNKDKEAISLNGKWNVENLIIKEYQNGSLLNTDTEPGDGTSFDFQNNGHLVISDPVNGVESHSYIIKPESKVEIDGDIYEMRNLTSSNVTLFIREDIGPGEYDELSINLKR